MLSALSRRVSAFGAQPLQLSVISGPLSVYRHPHTAESRGPGEDALLNLRDRRDETGDECGASGQTVDLDVFVQRMSAVADRTKTV
jgi:hypothetical protein